MAWVLGLGFRLRVVGSVGLGFRVVGITLPGAVPLVIGSRKTMSAAAVFF